MLLGQSTELPVHFSAESQTPADALHVYEADLKLSPGHAAEFPVQYSSTSHPPAAAARHKLAVEL